MNSKEEMKISKMNRDDLIERLVIGLSGLENPDESSLHNLEQWRTVLII